METLVLVHGSWGGAWCWEDVRGPLERAGHTVVTPTLPGLGERAAEAAPSVGLGIHIEDVVDTVLRRDLHDLVLIGHSYGGMVVTGVAARVPDRVRAVVYVDGFVPEPGQSCFDILPWLRDAFTELALEDRPWLVAPLDPTALGVSDAKRDGVLARLTPMPLKTHEEELPRKAKLPAVPTAFVHCAAQPYFDETAAALREKGWRVVRLDAPHMAMVTHPEELAEALLSTIASLRDDAVVGESGR